MSLRPSAIHANRVLHAGRLPILLGCDSHDRQRFLDTSGSMLQPLGDELQIDDAKSLRTDVVTGTLPHGVIA